MNPLRRTASLMVLYCCLAGTSPITAELVINGSFEAGNTGFTSAFTYSPGDLGPADVYDITTDPNLGNGAALSYGDHTTGSGLMMAVNGTNAEVDKVVWSETVSVVPNQTYFFSVFTSTWSNLGAGSLELRINGVALGPQFASGGGLGGIWVGTEEQWMSDAATTAVLEIVNTTVAFGGNDFALDDISFSETAMVPETATWLPPALIAVLLLANVFRRKRVI